MAAKEMYDYLSAVAADYTAVEITLSPQNVLTEISDKKQAVHEYDDGSVDVVTFSDDSWFKLILDYSAGISESDAGTLFDLYNDTLKANARERTWYFVHPDTHTYTVRFMEPLNRGNPVSFFQSGYRTISSIKLRVEGKKP